MYQFSLKVFNELYLKVIREIQTEGDRIQLILKEVTQFIFKRVCRGLFNKHKRIFAFNLATMIDLIEFKILDRSELRFFVSGLKSGVQDVNKPELLLNCTDEQWL
jgi:dynein heavy chain, axonemal